MRRVVFLLMLLLPALTVVPAQARFVSLPGYQQLFQKSDLIVVARPITKTRVTGKRAYFPGINWFHDGKEQKDPAVGLETTFEVLTTVKGDPSIKQFVLHHLGVVGLPDPDSIGPRTVSFDPHDWNCSGEFLMFLVRETDGRYSAYSGQTDPDSSIFSTFARGFAQGKCPPSS